MHAGYLPRIHKRALNGGTSGKFVSYLKRNFYLYYKIICGQDTAKLVRSSPLRASSTHRMHRHDKIITSHVDFLFIGAECRNEIGFEYDLIKF
jgi:hypothetical protein